MINICDSPGGAGKGRGQSLDDATQVQTDNLYERISGTMKKKGTSKLIGTHGLIVQDLSWYLGNYSYLGKSLHRKIICTTKIVRTLKFRVPCENYAQNIIQ